VLTLYRLTVRFAAGAVAEEAAALAVRVPELLERMEEEVEGRLSRAVVQAANARDSLRGDLAEARRASCRLAGFDRSQAEG
jgi:hypothetical protein